MDNKTKVGLHVGSDVEVFNPLTAEIKKENVYLFECFRDGKLIWTEVVRNLVVTAGLNDSIDKHFKGSGYTAAWYVGLTENSPTFAPGDTMAGAHAGWVETYNYDEATREALTLGSVSSGSADNSASKASFTISTGGDAVGGAFIVNESTKGGATGVLYGGGAFSQNRSLLAADILNVTVTIIATAA
jgi:hypothetical protein